MDEEILDDATLFGSPEKTKKEDKTFKPFEPEVFDKVIEDGTPGDLEKLFQDYGIESASVKNAYMTKQEKAATDKAMSARAFELAKTDLTTVQRLLKSKDYEYLGGKSAKLAGDWGMNFLTPEFGDAQRDLEKLKASKFLLNIDVMKGMGSLSNAEGSKLSAAANAVFGILPDENGNYPSVSSEKWIEDQLKTMEAEYTRAADRLTRGVRVDPETGKELSQQAFTKKNPDVSVPPTTAVEADSGTVDTTVEDLRGSTLKNKDINIKLNDFAKNAKPGQKLILPDGRTFVKQ